MWGVETGSWRECFSLSDLNFYPVNYYNLLPLSSNLMKGRFVWNVGTTHTPINGVRTSNLKPPTVRRRHKFLFCLLGVCYAFQVVAMLRSRRSAKGQSIHQICAANDTLLCFIVDFYFKFCTQCPFCSSSVPIKLFPTFLSRVKLWYL